MLDLVGKKKCLDRGANVMCSYSQFLYVTKASLDSYLALCEASLQIVYLYSDLWGIFTEMYATVWTVVSRTDVWQQFWNIYIFLSWKSAFRIHMKYISNKLIHYTMCVPLVSALQFTGPKNSCRHEWVSTQGKHYNAA